MREKVLERAQTAAPADVAALLEETVRTHTEALSRLTKTCDLAALSEAVALLKGARHVYVAGLRRSRPIADYLVYGLIRGERACSMLDFTGGMAGPQTSTMAPDDVLVAIAFPPYSAPVIDVAMDGHVSGRRIVAITDSAASPLAACAAVTLTVDVDAACRLQPISGAIAVVQTLILGVTTR